MQYSNLPAEFWGHAVSTAAYTINRLSHRRLPGRITPYEAMFDTRPNVKNLRVFGCHAEILIEKQYRRKDLSQEVSESAIFIGYCRQSTGYMFYIPSKHMVVSRRDAAFNQAYLPARVGDTKLIRTNMIKGGAGESGTIEDDAKNSQNDTKSVQNDTKIAQNNITNSDIDQNIDLDSKTFQNDSKLIQNDTKYNNTYENSVLDNEKQRVSPRPLLGRVGKPVASANTVSLKSSDAENELATPSQKYVISKYKSDKIEQSMQLRTKLDFIIRMSPKIAKAAPHILRERCSKADGASILEALKIGFTHMDKIKTYKKTDI